MTLTRNALGNLVNKYNTVLKKCHLLNTLGSLAVASVLVLGMGGTGMAADSGLHWSQNDSPMIMDSWGPRNSADSHQAGSYSKAGEAAGGNVHIDTGNSSYIYGGVTRTGVAANDNSVTMTGGNVSSITGGYSYSGNANNNRVTVSGGTITARVTGGNSATGHNNTNGNTVTISGGRVDGGVIGGIVANGNANYNTVIISGGIIGISGVTGEVVGGESLNFNSYANGNTVIYSGGTIHNNLFGGKFLMGSSSNNTLVSIGSREVGGIVENFQHYRFLLPASVAKDSIMLKVGGSAVNITNATVGVALMGSPSKLQKGDAVTLIDKTNGGAITVVNASDPSFRAPITPQGNTTISQKYGFLENYEFDVAVDRSFADNPLKATLVAITQKDDDNPYADNGDGLDDYIKAALARGEISAAFSTDPSMPGGVRFLSRAMDSVFGNASTDAAKAVESAMNAITVAAVPQMTMGANMAAVGAVTQRTSISMPLGSMQSATLASDAGDQSGSNAGDDISGMSAGNKYDKTGFGMWIMPLWQSNNTFGMKVGDNLEADTHANIGGIAIGADYTWDQMFRLGLTFNIGGGYAEGSGDLSKTTNNMNFWGIGAYAGWAYNNFGLTADVNYTSSYNKIKQEIHSSLQMEDFKSDVQSSAISAGLRGEYRFETSVLDITPHAGVRYMYLTTDEYDLKSGGQTVLKADSTHQNIWTFPVGVQFAKSFDMNNGWYVKPSLDLSIIPAAGDIEAKRDVRFTGVSGTLATEAQTMDWVSYGGQAGLEFGNGNMKLGLNYNLQIGAHSTNHGVFGTFRYEF